jgi:hypothetical protein
MKMISLSTASITMAIMSLEIASGSLQERIAERDILIGGLHENL